MASEEQGRRLDSWKEIADYLGRDVRTVIRWEKDKGLPVRRLPGGKRQSVFAFAAEIDAWLRQHDEALNTSGPPSALADDLIPSSADSGADSGTRKRHFFVAIVSVGTLALLVFLAWFTLRSRQPSAIPASASEVYFETPSGRLRFLRSNLDLGVQGYQFAAADLNHDGAQDLIFSSSSGDVVGVMLGRGDGTFLPARLSGPCPQSDFLTIADFNRDGHPDIAVSCTSANYVLVLWGKGDGTFPERTEIPIPGGPRFIASGDVNQDGWPELVVTSFNESALYILQNHRGKFSPRLLSRFEATSFSAIADLNGDGRLDIIAGIRQQGKYGLGMFFGKGDGTFPSQRFLHWDDFPPLLPGQIKAVDVTGDGILDLVFSFWNERLMISRGLGRGEFSAPQLLAGTGESGGWRFFAVADLDLDGKLDLLVPDNRSGALWYFHGAGDGTFTRGGTVTMGSDTVFPVVADFNGDGLPDIFVSSYFKSRATLLKADWKKEARRQPESDKR